MTNMFLQQIAVLKKENFSLKLRIYFLEERMQQKFGDGEDVFKTVSAIYIPSLNDVSVYSTLSGLSVNYDP